MTAHVHPFTGEILARRARPVPAEPRISDEDIESVWLDIGAGTRFRRSVVVINSSGRLGVLTEGEASAASPRIRVVGVYTCEIELDVLTDDVRWAETQARAEVALAKARKEGAIG